MKRRSLLTLLTAVTLTGLSAAAGAQAPEVAKVPDGSVAIHYYRPAGDYDGWGVHLWESFEKVDSGKIVGGKTRSDAPLQGISWMAPMKPTGKDGFGVYWHVKAEDFRNTKVNYIIHKGDTKDQCGKDMFWFLPQGNQIFVNQGDCNIYFTVDEALKARKK
ncbi:MAG TPA: pullulanase-associated domain-containing protein [Burkholderiaceae bacterium]|nr:pullulanase-associated domain-containing protein [Burkholderiaceae bacterium]